MYNGIWRRQWHPTPVLLHRKSHGWRSLVGCSPWGREELDMTERLHFPFSLSCIGEGNGNPLQCSCLENPRDGGAWWAAVYGVAQGWTRLKRLSSSSSIMAYIHQYGTMQSSFTALKILCSAFSSFSHAPSLETSNLFTVSVVFPFLKYHVFGITCMCMVFSEFFAVYLLRFLHDLIAHFFLTSE